MSGGRSHPWLDQGSPHWEDTWGGSYQLTPWGWEKKGREGGRSHKDGTGKTKCELGVSIGNSAFTFLLHFYFKHRKRERKQIEKKMCKKKEKKKRLNCFCFFFGNMSPFPFFPYSWFPNPKRCISSAPTPQVPSSGVGLGQEAVRETVTGRETRRTETKRDTGGGGDRRAGGPCLQV